MRRPKGYAPCRTEMGDDPIAPCKLRHRKALYDRQKGHCKGCSHRPKRSKGHGEISPIES